MRFYRIVISDPDTGQILVPNYKGKGGYTPLAADPTLSTYTSLNPGANVYTTGGTNPNALQVTIDIPVTLMNIPEQSNGYIKVHGISLAEVNQANNLTNKNITIYGGMAKGLPLANFKQAGILAQGQIQRAFGNYQGIETSTTFFLMGAGSSPSSNQTTGHPSGVGTPAVPSTNRNPANIIFVWTKGQALLPAMVNALTAAFPMYQIQGAVSENLVWSSGQDCVMNFSTLAQFSEWIHDKSTHMLGGFDPDPTQYMGVNLAFQNNTITIFDGSTQTTPKQIAFTDLIGQPEWTDGLNVQACVIMRGDIRTGDYVTLPPAAGVISQGAPPVNTLPTVSTYTSGAQFYAQVPGNPPNQSSIFQGTYYVASVRHVGQSRDANGQAWMSVLTLNWIPPAQIQPSAPVAGQLPIIYTGNSAAGYFLPS